jgi:hypothetical protein
MSSLTYPNRIFLVWRWIEQAKGFRQLFQTFDRVAQMAQM